MKNLNIYELLDGLKNVSIPRDISDSGLFPTVDVSAITDSSVLFLTDKVGRETPPLYASELSAMPAAIVASHTREVTGMSCPIIRVDNPREALAYALSNAYSIDYKKTKFIGITGTNGKTTAATLIYQILEHSGYKVGFIGTGSIISSGALLTDTTYSMTTPDPTVLYPAIATMQGDGCDYIVMEVSSHAIALGKVAPIKFDYAIFTNLGRDHLDFHGSQDEYFNAKLRLFDNVKRGLFNTDDEYSSKARRMVKCDVSTFGIINEADAYATEIDSSSLLGSSFFYRQSNLIFKAKTHLCGAFNVYNTLAALRCVIDLGIKPCIAKSALEGVEGISGRMELIDGSVRAVIDYAHTPEAFYNCIKTLKSLVNTKQKLTVVFGCGGDRDKAKRPLFGKYADEIADNIIITEDNCRSESFTSIAEDIAKGIVKSNYLIIAKREDAIRYAFMSSSYGDLVAIIGKGHEKYKIVGEEYLPFDEREIVYDAMAEWERTHEINT